MANTRQARAHRGTSIAIGAITVAVSLFCFLCTVGAFGSFGRSVQGVLVGFFGLADYAYSIIGMIIGLAIVFGIRPKMRFSRAVFYIGMLMLAILALQVYTSSAHIVKAGYGEYLLACYAAANTAGGMLYGLVAFPLMKAITGVGALVVVCVAFFVLAFFAILPSIKKNTVPYRASSSRERKASRQSREYAKEDRESQRKPGRRERAGHAIAAAEAPVLTDLSQAQQGGLYVVDVAGDPMPQKRGLRRLKGADGYRPIGSFDPLYPNKNGGFEDEMTLPSSRRESVRAYDSDSHMSSREALFGDDPRATVTNRYVGSGYDESSNGYGNAARRSELQARFGVDSARDGIREEYMSRFRAPQDGFDGNTQDNSNKFDFYAMKEAQDRAFSQSMGVSSAATETKVYTIGGADSEPIKKEVAKPTRIMPHYDSGSSINETIKKAENAVNSEVNVGMLGALNRSISGEEPQQPVVKEELTSVAYEKPQTASPINGATAAPVQQFEPKAQQPATKANVSPAARNQSISQIEQAGYTPVQGEKKIPRAFAATFVENGQEKSDNPARNVAPKPQNGEYEMLKPTLQRPAYEDKNPTQGGDAPSEPAPVRQQVTGDRMSRAAIQGATDIANQSGKDKERAEIQARIQNVKKAIKEAPPIGQFEREAMLREEKVKSSQNRGIKEDSAVKKQSGEKVVQVTMEQVIEQNTPRRPYVAPPVSLLKPPAPEVDQNEDYELKKERIIRTLNFFNIKGEVTEIKVGPTFTMYKLKVEMPRGKTIGYISSLENDIAMKMEAGSVRIIAPIPGEDAVGVEVPNKIRRNVNISEIIESAEFNSSPSPATMVLGKNLYGKSRVVVANKLPHALIAGATGAGKSCCINSIIISLLYKASPDDVRLILVDPKRVELSMYAGIPHLLMDEIIYDSDKAIRALNWAIQEMEHRNEVFQSVGCRELDEYNRYCDKCGTRRMPRIIIIVDEFADLMATGKKGVEDTINRIARLARNVGIHLILATQRPSTDVVSGTIKNNFPSRVAFKVTSGFDSKTILDSIGAEKLLGFGDMLYMTPGTAELERMQGAFISNEEVKNVIDFIKANNDSYFDNSIKDAIFKEAEVSKPEGGKDGRQSKDSLPPELFQALELGIELREDDNSPIAISYIQRKLGFGWPKAAKTFDMMMDMGFLTPDAKDKKKYIVNISREDLDALRLAAEGDGEEE